MFPHELLETAFEEFTDNRKVVACSSGTAALHLALETLDLPYGSEVILPDFTMVACARAVMLAGLMPVFVDVKADLTMDPRLVEKACTIHTSAIMAVHMYGRRCNMDAIAEIAAKKQAYLLEDLAEAHGVRPHEDTDAACWSFYKNKIIGGEEGGAVAFLEPEFTYRARQLRSLGFTEDHDYMHIPRGHNYRMSDSHAQLILDSIAKYDINLAERRRLEAMYDKLLVPNWRMPEREAPWVYDIRMPGLSRTNQKRLVQFVQSAGIAARMSFLPMTGQAEFSRARRELNGTSRTASQEVLYLPLTPGQVSDEDVSAACGALRSAVLT
jgi:perosamine synthetase